MIANLDVKQQRKLLNSIDNKLSEKRKCRALLDAEISKLSSRFDTVARILFNQEYNRGNCNGTSE